MKKLSITFVLMALAVSAFAQLPRDGFGSDLGTYERVTRRGPYLTNRFGDNWFIGVGGGVNLYFGTEDSRGSFGRRLAPAVDASIGKWFTPSVGFRVKYNGFQGRGWSSFPSPYANATASSNDLFRERWDYTNVHADLLWNLSNAIGGFRNDRFWSFAVYGGAGWAHTSRKNSGTRRNQVAPNAGLINYLRLGDVVDVTIEVGGVMVKSEFDAVKDRTALEGMLSLTAGLNFKLGPRGGFKRPIAVAPADYTPYRNRIERLEGELEDARERMNRLNRELEDCRNRPTAPVTVESKCMPTTVSAFFQIGRSNISDRDMVNIEQVAATIKCHPDKKFNVTGFADSNTGSVRRNQILSDERAANVADALVKFGVNRSQLIIEGRGGVWAEKNPALYRVVVIEQAQ